MFIFSSSFLMFLPLFICNVHHRSIYPGLYQRVEQEDQFLDFYGLIKNNKDARIYLLYKELTVLIPTSQAFKNYQKPYHSELAFYHMALSMRTIEELKTVQNISCVKSNFPKLWITKTAEGLFVNNAEINTFKSNYLSRSRGGDDGKQQILHIIDEVLDPIIRSPRFPHTAYDFMSSTDKWSLESAHTFTSFFHKVKENRLSHLYQLEGGNTYFIPVDRNIDSHKFNMLNKHTIFGHIVPNVVLFTRPTMKGFNYETMANDDYIYIILSLEEKDNKLYVKGSTILGCPNNPKGVFMAEIIEANIPVYNGVVHIISQPLGIFNRALKPFPFLPIMEKLATDPTLDVFYEMGEQTGFNKIFTTHNATFTYFVPNDYAWRQVKNRDLEFSGSKVDLLKRHLIVSDTAYSMERLLALTKSKNDTAVELRTVGGLIKVSVIKLDDHFYIQWYNTYIKVVRPNYECADGLMHILAGPIATF